MADHEIFNYISTFPYSKDHLYSYHIRPGALERLIPPWEKTTVIRRRGGVDPGGEVVMRMHAGPVPFHWVAHHVEHVPEDMFRDIMHSGPFSSWSHSHLFSGNGTSSHLEDRITYALPLHSFLPRFFRNSIRKTLSRTFQYREKVLNSDLALHEKYGGRKRKVLISGASGVLGKALCPLLTTGGHEVWKLVRKEARKERNELYWNPSTGEIDNLPAIDAVIHLAGEYIGLGRWSKEKKREVIESREKGTALLTRTCAALPTPPEVFLSASAVGYYGDTGDQQVKENYPAGSDFISHVCRAWEDSTQPARESGIRTVLLRIGIALSPGGGALQRLLSTSSLGFFRRFGSGEQYISWISLDDTISAIYHAMCCPALHGAINIAAPQPVTNSEFMKVLSSVSGKPCTIPVPSKLLSLVYGQMAKEILLSGCKVDCSKLVNSGFTFRHPTLKEALLDLMGKFEIKE